MNWPWWVELLALIGMTATFYATIAVILGKSRSRRLRRDELKPKYSLVCRKIDTGRVVFVWHGAESLETATYMRVGLSTKPSFADSTLEIVEANKAFRLFPKCGYKFGTEDACFRYVEIPDPSVCCVDCLTCTKHCRNPELHLTPARTSLHNFLEDAREDLS